AAPPAPELRVVSVTVNERPAPAASGAVNAVSSRSGPTRVAPEAVLLPSSVSTRASASSAFACRYHVPVERLAGSVTEVVAVLLAPAARPGTLRVPTRVAEASSVAASDA